MKEQKKTVPETGVKSNLAFCLGSLSEKTNSEGSFWHVIFLKAAVKNCANSRAANFFTNCYKIALFVLFFPVFVLG